MAKPKIDGHKVHKKRIKLCKKYGSRLFKNGRISKCGCAIFVSLSKILKMTPKSVYLFVKRNADQILPGIVLKDLPNSAHTATSVKKKTADAMSAMSPTRPTIPISFAVNITDLQIFQLETRPMKHRKKIVNTVCVKKGWSDKLFSVLWDNSDFNCVWSFKRAWVKSGSTVLAKGSCVDCKAEIMVRRRTDGQKSLEVCIRNMNASIKHSSDRRQNRHASGHDKTVAKLKDQSAFAVRMDIINSNLNDERRHPHLPTLVFYMKH